MVDEQYKPQTKNKKKRLKADYDKLNYVSYCLVRLSKKYNSLDRSTINKVITLYFSECRDEISTGQRVNLPMKMGGFYATKKKRGVYYDEDTGKIINDMPVNIAETVKFWKKYPEKKGITYIRYVNEHSQQYSFKLKFDYSKAVFKNKTIYKMNFNSSLKKEFSKNIFDKKVDAYLEKEYKKYRYE